MYPNHVRIPVRVMETDQGKENFTRLALDHLVEARVLSFRSQEAQDQVLPNQDYVRLACRKDISSLCFCVCDGVGSSYKGDFAARYLAEQLVTWLQGFAYGHDSLWGLSRRLKAHLNQLPSMAQADLLKLKVSDDVPPLVQEVLEELCTTYGSETVFFCGRVDYDPIAARRTTIASHAFSTSPPIRALFFWMGNVAARLFETPEQYIALGDSTDDSGRWSTLRGCRGKLHYWHRALPQLERLTVYTDGFDVLGPLMTELDDDECLEYARQLLSLPTSDDMTALDLHWNYHQAPQVSENQPAKIRNLEDLPTERIPLNLEDLPTERIPLNLEDLPTERIPFEVVQQSKGQQAVENKGEPERREEEEES